MTQGVLPSADLHLLLEGIDTLEIGITVFDGDLRLIAANRRFCTLLDFPSALCRTGTSFEDFLRHNAMRGEYGAGDVDEQVARRLALARQFQPHHFERNRPDGVILDVRGHPLPSGGMITIYTDISEQRQRERALKALSEELEQRVEERTTTLRERESELARKTTLLEQVTTHMQQGISFVNADLQLEYCNPQFIETMRFPPELVTPGMPFAAFIRHNAERGEYGTGEVEVQVQERVALARQGRAHRFERIRPDGSAVEIIGTPTPDGGFVTTYLDITERKRAEAALRASEQRFRDVASAASDWFFETDAELRFNYFSERFQEAVHIAPQTVLGKRREEVADPASLAAEPEKWARHFDDLRQHRPFRDFDYPMRDANGVVRHIKVSAVPAFDDQGQFLGYRGAGTDISAIRVAEQALRDNEAQLRRILGMSPIGVALLHAATRTLHFCNERFAQLMGSNMTSLTGLVPDGSTARLLDGWQPGTPGTDHELALPCADGTCRWLMLSLRPTTYQGDEAVLTWVYDVTELHQAREQLDRLAHHDALTGVPNRRYFEQAARQSMSRAGQQKTQGALLFIDLDGFKEVNDRHGHATGDLLLQTLAREMTTRLRKSDVLARLGGDEFAIITEGDSDDSDLENFARKLIELITRTAQQLLADCHVSASIGVARYNLDGPDLSTLLSRADDAMYRAKAAGKATVRFEAPTHTPSDE